MALYGIAAARSFIVADILNLHLIPLHVLFQRTSTVKSPANSSTRPVLIRFNGIRRSTAEVDVSRWGLAVKIWTPPGAIAFQRSEYSLLTQVAIKMLIRTGNRFERLIRGCAAANSKTGTQLPLVKCANIAIVILVFR